MTYQISLGTGSYYDHPVWPQQPYLVEKVLDRGEAYTIGTFKSREHAEACWNSLRHSEEVARGAKLADNT